MATATEPSETDPRRALGSVDRGLYALFSRHADQPRHERDREVFRGAGISTSFDVFLVRLYGYAWVCGLLSAGIVVCTSVLLPATWIDAVVEFLLAGIPALNRIDLPSPPLIWVGLGTALGTGFCVRWLVIRLGGQYLRRAATARREAIERTLPGAVRYLRVLASGTNDQRSMLARVASQDAYGATGESFQRALNKATLTGSLDRGLSMVARETPSRDLLSPFLLKFREHAAQGNDSLEGYLKMEGRLLSHRQSRRHQRASGSLELVAELFVVLLVFPALIVLILTLASVMAPGLSEPIATPVGPTTVKALLVYLSALFVLLIGAGAAWTVARLRPDDKATPTHDRPSGFVRTMRTAHRNPPAALLVAGPGAAFVTVVLALLGHHPVNAILLGYAVFGIPVGAVAVRRAALDDAKDREIRDFVHAVSGHVSLGRPFPDAVQRVARDVDLGALQSDVDALAFNLGLTTQGAGHSDVQAAALDRFVDRVGTPLTAQTVGLVVGALEAGSSTEDVFETLETEIGRLYHERKALRARLLVYVAVGWTTALLVVGIVVAVNATVLDGFAQLSAVSDAGAGMTLAPDAIDPVEDGFRFYLVTQATVVASGWFAGVASRGRYEALLHSGLLVLVTYIVFAGMGMA